MGYGGGLLMMNQHRPLTPRLLAAFWAALLILALPALARAQGTPAYQSGLLSKPGNLSKMTRNGQYQDAGGILGDAKGLGVNPFAITDKGDIGICSSTASSAQANWALCLGHDTSGNAVRGLWRPAAGRRGPSSLSRSLPSAHGWSDHPRHGPRVCSARPRRAGRRPIRGDRWRRA